MVMFERKDPMMPNPPPGLRWVVDLSSDPANKPLLSLQPENETPQISFGGANVTRVHSASPWDVIAAASTLLARYVATNLRANERQAQLIHDRAQLRAMGLTVI